MNYANSFFEIIEAFSTESMEADELDRFYCNEAIEIRVDDKDGSSMSDIVDIYTKKVHRACLLIGQRGCGKSTELHKLSAIFEKMGYPIRIITCHIELDLIDISFSDLFIMIGKVLLEIVAECNYWIEDDLLCNIVDFWSRDEKIIKFHVMDWVARPAEILSETTDNLSRVLNLLSEIQEDLKYNKARKKVYRSIMSNHVEEWVQILGCVSKKIMRKTEGKWPIIIFDDLDRLNEENAWSVFYNFSNILSGMPFPIIYTFPLSLSVNSKFLVLNSYFIIKKLPMIRVESIEGEGFYEGIGVMKEIVRKRADLRLFDNKVLEYLIQYTGGSLRDLFHAIVVSARRAERRKGKIIIMEDAQCALDELSTALTRCIQKKDVALLVKIYNKSWELIHEQDELSKMLQALVVLEYNGHQYDVHPLVIRYLDNQLDIKR